MDKLVKDFLVNSPALRTKLGSKDDVAFSDGKAIELARVLKRLQAEAKYNKDDNLVEKLIELEHLALAGLSSDLIN
jgi:hypothetical protein